MKKYLPSAVFALIVSAFWAFLYQYHLYYQEQVQLFTYTWSQLASHLAFPGGLIGYAAEFLTQFFLSRWAGAMIIAALLALLQIMTLALMDRVKKTDGVFVPLSFIPSICAWAFLADSVNMLGSVIALIAVIAAFLAADRRPCLVGRCALVALLYWLCGPVAIVFIAMDMICGNVNGKWLRVVLETAAFAVSIAGAAAVCRQYPLKVFFIGINYNVVPSAFSADLLVLVLSPLVTFFVAWFLSESLKMKRRWLVVAVMYALVAFFGGKYVASNFSSELERIYAYDISANRRDWNQIFNIAAAVPPSTPSEMTCVNLALAMTGNMGGNMFYFDQHGPDGLYPGYESGYLMMLPAGEALYQCGLLNMSMHYAFEAYETFPDFRESARQLKRLSEVNMINGQYAVADKYLEKLSHTMFYRKWAQKYLGHPENVLSDPEYARLYELRDTTSGLLLNDLPAESKQAALRAIVGRTGKAGVSYDYLLATDLLAKDLDAFLSDFALVGHESPLPVHYQEALMLQWLRGTDPSVMDSPLISDAVKERVKNMRGDIMAKRSTSYMSRTYGNTYWYYFARNN